MAVPAAIRSGEALRAVEPARSPAGKLSDVGNDGACGVWWSARLPASAAGCASLTRSKVTTSTCASSGGGVRSASTSAA